MKRIGHGGASALAPANTLRSFELAQELGADAVEFDVRLLRGRLLVAHTVLDGCRPGCLELEPAVDWIARELDPAVELVVDLKTPGTEAPVLDALRRHGLLERATLTSQCRPILATVRSAEPLARTAISIAGRVSRSRQRWRRWRDEVLREVQAGAFDALMLHRGLVDRSFVAEAHAAAVQVYAWTARHAEHAAQLAALDVDGIVATDPRFVPRA